MKTTMEEFNLWLTAPRENENLEFKEAKTTFATPKIYKYCVALANEGGGYLVLGVTDKLPRKVVGTKAVPNIGAVTSQIFNKLNFRVDIEEFTHPDGRVIIFHIPSRPSGTAYQYEGAYLMRSSESTVPMSEDRLRDIFNEGKPDWFQQIAIKNCSISDVVNHLNTQIYFDLLNRPYPSSLSGVLEKFKSESLVVKSGSLWNITNLGAILFAKKLYDLPELRSKCVRMIVYHEKNKLDTRLDKTFEEGYAVGFKNWIDFINGIVPSNEVINKALRSELKMFPETAIRELLANALVHQDFFETGVSIRVELYCDRLEISNPGTPLIPVERFIDEEKSRNEVLTDLMRRLSICEKKGSGLDRVVSQAEIFQLPAPDFQAGQVHTKAILYSQRDFKDMSRDDRVRACFQHCTLKYVMNEKMTNPTLRERFQLPSKKSETVSRIIADTIAREKIKLSDPSVISSRYRSYIPYWA